MTYTKADLARALSLTRGAITNACSRGQLFSDKDGKIDLDDPRNSVFLSKLTEDKRVALKTYKSIISLKSEDKKKSTFDRYDAEDTIYNKSKKSISSDIDDMEIEELQLEKIKADLLYKKESAESLRIKRLETLGLLVEGDHVKKVISKYAAEQRIRLLELPKSISPKVVSLVESGAKEIEISSFLEKEISSAILGAKRIALSIGSGVKDGS